ncbi:Protein ENL YEATS domain-containing protein 1 [Larimichthys crocea]|uniref:Protein ENL YEATS domain-containing protein 1 n=1 Tax=Larimichthys crocea TaxID=215358 RepID=A0A6G0IRA3_LARCR|nr:Protein ENL YEATS domain-containing protein 1 [Larimichthys crocea]
MENQCTVQVKLELGHRAQLRKKVTSEGFTHDWMVFVRGPETGDIQHFVERVVFRLHESFPKPKRVCKEPPYKVEESGYAGFLMPIEVYFKNKEEPKKVCFNYDLFLNLEGNPPVNHLRCEKLTFNNPTKEFRRKLIKAGGVLVVPEGAEAVSRPSPDYPMLPTIPLSAFSDPKKTKTSHVSKEPSKDGSGGSSKGPKPHKLTKEHRERPRKDSESKATSKGDNDRDGSSKSGRDPSSSSSSSSKKPSEIKVKDEVKVLPKAAFKEPKLTLKESKMEGMSPKGGGAGSGGGGGGGGGGGPTESKAPGKRPSNVESPKPSAKKQKKGSSEGPKGPTGGTFAGTSPRVSSSSAVTQPYAEKKPPKDKGRWAKGKNDTQETKETKKIPESEESNSETKHRQSQSSRPPQVFPTPVRALTPVQIQTLSLDRNQDKALFDLWWRRSSQKSQMMTTAAQRRRRPSRPTHPTATLDSAWTARVTAVTARTAPVETPPRPHRNTTPPITKFQAERVQIPRFAQRRC